MTLRKCFILACTVALTTNSYAQSSISRGKTAVTTPIHTLTITNQGSRSVPVHVSLKIGRAYNGVCSYVYSEDLPPFALNYNSYTQIILDGDALAHRYGLSYTCAGMIVETDKQVTNDIFYLYNDGYDYSATSPNYDEVNVN